MADTRSVSQIQPGKGLGWITLGASLHGVVSRLKAQPQVFPNLELSYSTDEPILEPIVITLPANGIRLRFDGPDQRLRLIEVVDFSYMTFIYKNLELVRRSIPSDETTGPTAPVSGPSFRHIYNRLFGPTYAGEYIPPASGQSAGTYILSYPGIAVRFPLRHKLWSEKADFVSLLTTAASPATSMAIFLGSSWPEARKDLYTKPPSLPRSMALAGRNVETSPHEIENVMVHNGGQIELLRRSSSPFVVQLSQTTPQEIVAELGPPDAIFRKNSSRLSIHAAAPSRNDGIMSSFQPSSVDTDRSSGISLDDESDLEVQTVPEDCDNSPDMFYNYFHHGFDILISTPTNQTSSFPESKSYRSPGTDHKLVATKMFLHANIPGSYSFNRHRRSRWTIPVPSNHQAEAQAQYLTSEMRFSIISDTLRTIWRDHYTSPSQQESFERGMVLNRGWGESPESSIELLGEMEESTSEQGVASALKIGGSAEAGISSNTQLFGFPGMLFEVVKGDLVSCLTIY